MNDNDADSLFAEPYSPFESSQRYTDLNATHDSLYREEPAVSQASGSTVSENVSSASQTTAESSSGSQKKSGKHHLLHGRLLHARLL